MEPCKFEDKINEMHGDVKVLVSEFKAMNGTLKDTKTKVEEHVEESKHYRTQVDILWSALHTIKWAIGLLCAGGVLFRLVSNLIK